MLICIGVVVRVASMMMIVSIVPVSIDVMDTRGGMVGSGGSVVGIATIIRVIPIIQPLPRAQLS